MGDKTVVVKRTFRAPLDKVWNAWTDAEEIKQWESPEPMTTPDAAVDLKVGGQYFITMAGGEAPGPVTARGVFKEVDPMKKLVYSWKWDGGQMGEETLVTLEFKKISDNETEVILTHDLFEDENQAKEHKKGWESTYNKLEKYLA